MKSRACYWKGNEPSPKGLGRCAHLEHAGTVALGRDGKIWKAEMNKNGVVRWVAFKNGRGAKILWIRKAPRRSAHYSSRTVRVPIRRRRKSRRLN